MILPSDIKVCAYISSGPTSLQNAEFSAVIDGNEIAGNPPCNLESYAILFWCMYITSHLLFSKITTEKIESLNDDNKISTVIPNKILRMLLLEIIK